MSRHNPKIDGPLVTHMAFSRELGDRPVVLAYTAPVNGRSLGPVAVYPARLNPEMPSIDQVIRDCKWH